MKFHVSSHTDYITVGSTYVAIVGESCNGTQFISQAIENGATKIVVQEDQLTSEIKELCIKNKLNLSKVECISVPNARIALAELSAQAYDYPAKKLKILGVTGTDGKTSSVYLLYLILKQAGKRVALLSGVENIIGDYKEKASLTTPKPDYMQYFLDQCVQQDIEYVVMEVSAQATTLHRIDGIEFDGLIFTNFAAEHGECYQTIDDYFAAKVSILKLKKMGAPLIVSSNHCRLREIQENFDNVFVAGSSYDLAYFVEIAQQTAWKQLLDINIEGKHHFIETELVGEYNASNIIGVVALADKLGMAIEDSIQAIEGFTGVLGRLEKFQLLSGAYAIVDYAHTPQAFEAILSRLKKYAKNLTVIFGAAGGKDPKKRPKMGVSAACYADTIILTNDNPKFEDPEEIMDDIIADLSIADVIKIKRMPDRADAIAYACNHAQHGDIIAILGKGAETVQLCGNQRLPHSDLNVVQKLMQN